MPRSKRSRPGTCGWWCSVWFQIFLWRAFSLTLVVFAAPVALTKTEKRTTRQHKTVFVEQVRSAIDQHDTIYVFQYQNTMRSNHFQTIRMHFRPSSSVNNMQDDDDHDVDSDSSRIFLGKNKLLQIALGRTSEEEYSDNLRHLSKLLSSDSGSLSVGLLCTNRPGHEVESYFAQLELPDFARAGAVADREVTVSNEQLQAFPGTMVEQFRKLGLPVDINNGTVVLRETSKGCNDGEYRVCKEGSALSAEQCKLLVHFGIKVSTFRVAIAGRWVKDTCEFTKMN
jgi:mRNA turnover protein 4